MGIQLPEKHKTYPSPWELREKLGDDEVDELIDLIKQSNSKLGDDEVDASIDLFVFLEYLFRRRLTDEIAKINQNITEQISKVNQKISESHANLIKWMFIFWIGQISVILGILFAFFK